MKNFETYLHSFVPVLPAHKKTQAEIVAWIMETHERSGHVNLDRRRMGHFCLSQEHIKERHFECSDIVEEWPNRRLYKIDPENPYGAEIGERNLYYAERSQRIFKEIYPNFEICPEHIIHVTCTGYISPSPAQIFFSKRNLKPEITHAYHMGCYASLPAVRMAQGIVSSQKKSVDIVHTEMCSLHLNASVHTPEQMIVQSLFADGNIKYEVSPNLKRDGFKIKLIQEMLIPDSLNDMTWFPSAYGMEMSLSRNVPEKIGQKLNNFIEMLCSKANINQKDTLSNAIFAIHPGGPKIIEAVQKKFKLSEEQVAMSYKVFKERGNMSSATLPHVWKEINDQKRPSGTKVVSLAFGPGLTIFGSLFEVV